MLKPSQQALTPNHFLPVIINTWYKITNRPFILIVLSLFFISLAYQVPGFYSLFTGEKYNPITNIFSFIYLDFHSFICFFVFPVIASKAFFREKIKDLGFQFPQRKVSISIILAILFLVPFLIMLSHQKSFQHYYSFGNINFWKFTFIQMIFLPLYYISEEFFFRGFLFVGLWKRIGWHSYWITELLFAIAHIGKPWLEIPFTIPVGIVLSYLTLKSKSIVPAIIVHTTLGILMNFFVRGFH